MAAGILLILFWIIMVFLTVTQYIDVVAGEDVPIANKLFAGLIFIIGAPIFCAYTALSGILDYILPDNWEDNDKF